MDENGGGEIRQGFICPLCMEDLGNQERLLQHVDNVHSNEEGNLEAVNIIKGMFAKAKSKLTEIDFSLNISGQSTSSDVRNSSSSHIYQNDIETPQVMGVSRSHTSYYTETQREHTEIATVHTNTLILRLDKLLNELSLEGTNRKEFEKRTVPWADDSDCTNCRVCDLKFSLTKRKHHCRLCGKVICSTCSKFLSFKSAQKITSYVSKPFDSDVEAMEEHENYMRICAMCKEHLQRYELRRDLNTVSSVFIDLYGKLCTLLTQINNLAPSFRRMANSLQKGESLYTLESAIQLRKKIVYIQSEISNLSERIQKWGLNNDPIAPRKPTPREMIVQDNIRRLAVKSLQDVFENMPQLPNEQEYEQLHKLHKERVANREKTRNNFFNENQHSQVQGRHSNPFNRLTRADSSSSDVGADNSLFASLAKSQSQSLRTSASFSGLSAEESWAPSTNNIQIPSLKKAKNPFMADSEEEDEEDEQLHPMLQQYLILKSYLKQAAEAGKKDETVSLENSILDIQKELMNLGIETPRAS